MRLLLCVGVVLLQAIISVRTELVAVPVIVTDGRGQHVSGLVQENFRVLENGRPQPVAVFHHGDTPVTLGLIVDRSQSMRTKTHALRTAVSALLQWNGPGDELFAVGFNDHVSFALPDDVPFTSDVKRLETALAAVPAEGQTVLYDGVVEGLKHLHLGRAEKRVLIVVSDGGDNASRETYASLVELARRSDAVIYAIGLLSPSPADEVDEDAGLLTRLCKDTGGLAYFPRTTDEVAAMSTQVARDIRDQYILGFVPGEGLDRRAFRKIEVTVTAPGQGRLRVRTRSGYILGGDAGATNDKDNR